MKVVFAKTFRKLIRLKRVRCTFYVVVNDFLMRVEDISSLIVLE